MLNCTACSPTSASQRNRRPTILHSLYVRFPLSRLLLPSRLAPTSVLTTCFLAYSSTSSAFVLLSPVPPFSSPFPSFLLTAALSTRPLTLLLVSAVRPLRDPRQHRPQAHLSQGPSFPHFFSNSLLTHTLPQIWLPTLTVAWGITATLQGLVKNESGFYAARFFMVRFLAFAFFPRTSPDALHTSKGVAEAGLFPGCIYVFSW